VTPVVLSGPARFGPGPGGGSGGRGLKVSKIRKLLSTSGRRPPEVGRGSMSRDAASLSPGRCSPTSWRFRDMEGQMDRG
jgi:hypothetical protein